eukprot:2411203-Prymnesium_polylepis.1
MPHGSAWDSRFPSECVVLTGDRPGWPGFGWGWSFWEERYGDDVVTSRQRAPIFDSDASAATVGAESSLREYIRYARGAHAATFGRDSLPLLYMNGWEVFDVHPELWDASLDKLPGTIENLTASEYRHLASQTEGGTSLDDIAPRVRHFCKIFMGPTGVVTRMHQDNHWAHAWLSQVRGRKLYVVCSPRESAKMRACGASADHGGTTREARFDPLDPAQLGERLNAGLNVYAAVLQPGETLVAPNGWWHYAVSLTPSITLMCNFWDHANLKGLHHMMRQGLKPLAPTTSLAVVRAYRVVHAPYVYLRAGPSQEHKVLGVAQQGTRLQMDAESNGWYRTRAVVADGEQGWVLLDGAKIGLGVLLELCE